jgi:heme exporter protein C
MLMYMAYLILRGSFDDEQRRSRISAVYNIFAFAVFVPLIFIVPRLTDSLHPGNGGNPAFGKYDMDNNVRMVFYPAVIGFTLLGVWITELRVRLRRIKVILDD